MGTHAHSCSTAASAAAACCVAAAVLCRYLLVPPGTVCRFTWYCYCMHDTAGGVVCTAPAAAADAMRRANGWLVVTKSHTRNSIIVKQHRLDYYYSDRQSGGWRAAGAVARYVILSVVSCEPKNPITDHLITVTFACACAAPCFLVHAVDVAFSVL